MVPTFRVNRTVISLSFVHQEHSVTIIHTSHHGGIGNTEIVIHTGQRWDGGMYIAIWMIWIINLFNLWSKNSFLFPSYLRFRWITARPRYFPFAIRSLFHPIRVKQGIYRSHICIIAVKTYTPIVAFYKLNIFPYTFHTQFRIRGELESIAFVTFAPKIFMVADSYVFDSSATKIGDKLAQLF